MKMPDSPLAKPLPRSPKIAKIQEQIAKKSPLRSPLRDVLKKRCAERMKNNRSKLLDGLRGVEEIQKEIRDMIHDEAAAFRLRRRSLSFGLTEAEVDEALEDLEVIELELMEVAEILSDTDLGVVCPICLKHALTEESSVISCKGNCGRLFCSTGGLMEAEKKLDSIVETHSKGCDGQLVWGAGGGCLMAICEHCEFCSAVGDV